MSVCAGTTQGMPKLSVRASDLTRDCIPARRHRSDAPPVRKRRMAPIIAAVREMRLSGVPKLPKDRETSDRAYRSRASTYRANSGRVENPKTSKDGSTGHPEERALLISQLESRIQRNKIERQLLKDKENL